MGEKLEAWKEKEKDEAAQNAKDFKARVVAVDTLLKDMKAYQAALGKTKSAKFKGKNPVEQAKMNSDPKIKVALEAYEKQGNEINKLVNSTKTQDPAKVWAGCQLALTGLAFAIGAN